MRLLCLALLAAATPLPALAQTPSVQAPSVQAAPDARAEAAAAIAAHRVNLRVGCPIPVPATFSAPVWEQRAANARRDAFERCLDGAMAREQARIEELAAHVDGLRAAAPAADWSDADLALAAKWEELGDLESKLRTKQNWADTAVSILDTFTGPGAPFGPQPPAFNPYSPYGGYNRCAPYRCDSSISARGIR